MVAGLLVTALAYAIGSISFGYLVVRWRTARDIRGLGTGSAGARNVARQLGLGWGVVSAILDIAKGTAATAVAVLAAPDWLIPAAAAVVAGHVWPAPLRFRGGRGIAPAFGASIVIDPVMAAVALAVLLGVTAITRRSMAGYAAGVVVAPLVVVLEGRDVQVVAAVLAVLAVVLIGHAPLLGRLRPLGAGR